MCSPGQQGGNKKMHIPPPPVPHKKICMPSNPPSLKNNRHIDQESVPNDRLKKSKVTFSDYCDSGQLHDYALFDRVSIYCDFY